MGEITDKTEALSAVKADSWELENVSDELKADKEVVMVAVKNNGDVFEYASDELKADKEVAMAAVKLSAFALDYVSDDLKADKEFVISAVELVGWGLQYASDDLKADKEVVMTAIKDMGSALQHASDDLKADKEVVMAAVKEDGDALQYAADDLRTDSEILDAVDVDLLKKRGIIKKEKNEMELSENTTYRIAIVDHERLILNMVYAEVGEEIFGAYSGMISSGPHVCYFHQDQDGEFTVSDDYFEFETNHDLSNIFSELDDLRNEFEIWDDEGDSFEFSDAGKEFIATNESINDDGWLEAYSDGASEDFIYDLQDEWQLSLRKD